MADQEDPKPGATGTPSPDNPYAPGPAVSQTPSPGPAPADPPAPTSAPPVAADGPAPYNPYGPPPGAYGPAATPESPYGAPGGAPGPVGGQGPSPYPSPSSYPVPERPPFPGVAGFVIMVLIGLAVNLTVSTIALFSAAVAYGANVKQLAEGKVLDALPAWLFFAVLLASSLCWPAVALVAARIYRVWTRDQFRWRLGRLGPVLLGGLLGVALVPVALAIEYGMSQVIPRGDNPMVEVLLKQPSVVAMVLLGLALVVSAPIGEEILFRGVALSGMEKRYGLWPAAMIISIVFAVIHLNFTGFPALLLVSMILCWLTSRTDSLIPAIALHATYNGSQFLMMLPATQSKEAAQKALDAKGFGLPPWVVAAALLAAVALMLLIAVATRHRARSVD